MMIQGYDSAKIPASQREAYKEKNFRHEGKDIKSSLDKHPEIRDSSEVRPFYDHLVNHISDPHHNERYEAALHACLSYLPEDESARILKRCRERRDEGKDSEKKN